MTKDVQAAGSAIGRQIEILAASTERDIDAAFATLAKKRADALVVSPDPLLDNRRVQIVTLAAHQRLPAIYSFRENVDSRRPDELRVERERPRIARLASTPAAFSRARSPADLR